MPHRLFILGCLLAYQVAFGQTFGSIDGEARDSSGAAVSGVAPMASKLTKRFSHGVTALVAYTWSKSIDETSGVRTEDRDSLFSQNGNCLRCERGLSAFDNRQRLVISGLYDVPAGRGRAMDIHSKFLDAILGGWQLGSTVTWRSGFPINPSDGVNRANTNIGVDRPNTTGVSQSLADPTTAKWFNTAFTLRPLYTFGDAGRNSVIGPAGFYCDIATHKSFRMPKEGHDLQFRWKAFNLGLQRGEKCA